MICACDLPGVERASAGSVGQVRHVDGGVATVAWPGFGTSRIAAAWLQPAVFCDCGLLWISGNGLEKLACQQGHKVIAQQVGVSRALRKYRFELESAIFWELINKWFVRNLVGTLRIYLNLQPEAWKEAGETWTHKCPAKIA